ncbi:MAG: ankyrin repeat domain-containing protein [Candidatus Aminicenantes bacterium]|nr:ankyrin repeat domain-containing protein [Candidatus Aminicenantes bacterium]
MRIKHTCWSMIFMTKGGKSDKKPADRISLGFVILLGIFLIMSPLFSQDIYEAVQKGDVDTIRKILEQDPERLDAPDKYGFTPLHRAVIYGRNKVIVFLIGKGADIKGHNKALRGWTPLQSALFAYNNEISDLLVDYGALKEIDREEGLTYLYLAASSGNAFLISKLVEKGIPAAASNKYGVTPLHKAACNGHIDAAKVLLEKGADINAKNLKGEAPIHVAERAGEEETVLFLKQKGADTKPSVFPLLKGPYLGMPEPGDKPEIFAPGIISTDEREHGLPVFSPDGSEFFICIQFRERYGKRGQYLFRARMENNQWTDLHKPSFTTRYRNGGGAFSPDGSKFYFHTIRPVKESDERNPSPHIWYVEKTKNDWGKPSYLGCPVNAEGFSGSPWMTANGSLYFSAERGTENTDVYRSRCFDGRFLEPEKLPAPISTEHYDSLSYVSPDESCIILYRIDFTGEVNIRDLLIFFRQKDDSWSDPKSLKDSLGLKGSDLLKGCVSPDGKYLFLLDDMDIYWVKAGVIEKLR